MRYTEARIAYPAMEMLADLNMDTVDFEPNYDETRTEPTVLPSKFPNLLCTGSSGIAVGMATNIPPHNLSEVCDAIMRVIDQPDAGFEELIKLIPGPEFPTGGFIVGKKGIHQAYKTGKGIIKIRGRGFVEKVGKAGARTVEIGIIGREKAQITKGIESGDKIIVTGHHDVEDGTRVTIQ